MATISTYPISFAEEGHSPLFFSRGSLGPVEFAFTTRVGGHSAGPYRSLNLGGSTPVEEGADEPQLIRRNLATLAEAIDVPVTRTMSQVHGSTIAFIGANEDVPIADAMITDRTGVGLVVRVADCTPIVLADPKARLIAVVHAGRAGLVNEIAPATVRAMRARGATRIQAWLGPRACGACYELPQEMVDEISAQIPAARSRTSKGSAGLDVGAGILAQLAAEDVGVSDLGAGVCTIEDEQFFSYRRQGARSGRQGAIILLHPDES